MKQSGLTLQERQLIMLLRWWVGLFAAATIGFAIFPSEIISSLNTIGHVFFKWSRPALNLPSEHFWQILAVSLLVLLTVISFIAQRNIRQNLSYVPLIILSKFVTTAGFLTAFLLGSGHFAYLTGVVVDGFIFVMTWFCYHRTQVSRAF